MRGLLVKDELTCRGAGRICDGRSGSSCCGSGGPADRGGRDTRRDNLSCLGRRCCRGQRYICCSCCSGRSGDRGRSLGRG